MKEQIAKLANESGFDVDKTGTFGNYSEMHRLEKFAELIVKECARVARVTPAPNFHEHLKQQLGHTWDMAASEAGREIVKHFGVEE